MKKFLSLLLALTMVLSLTVVPARADNDELTWKTEPKMEITKGSAPNTSKISSGATVEKGTSLTFTVTETDVKKGTTDASSETDYTIAYSWSGSTDSVTTAGSSNPSATIPNVQAGTIVAKCTVTVTPKSSGEAPAATLTKVLEATITVNDPEATFKDAVKNNITYNGRPCTYTSADNKITYYALSGSETIAAAPWAASATGYTNVVASFDGSSTLTVKGTPTGGSEITTTFSVEQASASFAANASISEVITGGQVTLTASNLKGFNNATYTWYYGDTSTQTTPCIMSGNVWSVPSSITSSTNYTVKGVATVNGVEAATANTTVTVIPDTFTIKVTASPSSVSSTTTPVIATATMYNGTTAITGSTELAKITNWRLTKTDTAGAFNTSYTTGNPMTLYAAKSGSAYITATATYKGKTITTALNGGATVTSSLLSYTLPAIQSGSYGTYSNYNLLSYANTIAFVGRPVNGFQSISVYAQTDKNNLGVLTMSGSGTTAQYTFSNVNATRKVGVAQFAATAYTGPNNTGTAYTVYFNVPVEPTGTTYADQYPEPVASYGNTYRYYVQVPSGYSSYYVVGTPNQAVRPTDWSQGSSTVYYTNTTTTSLYPLTDSNFVNGKCTLWIVTADSYGRLSCGQLSVYQKNYNINYNGVAGETVQFKHADFTNFMNEVSQARGDASKTGSYPYVTFNYVTFNYPTSTQGTLYYNGTAMSNSSYSGSFNSRTQITNLDNVTFVPYARTSAKSIPLTFTLSVTKYGANGAVVNRDLKYTGTVVVSIVREDIKYTAAPGDTIRFTDSDFLNYLRTQNGFNSNYYSIDYVTFDQSAVNALNEGVLYAYSTGFNAVKTTDKFYYTTTSYNQNALSDVTFRASAYAKTGTTVYIPFTIYARYGTTGTGTRQVSGTVAIKIAQTMNFVDVKPTDYFYDSVKWAVNSNITKGTSATTFSPYKTCTRAEIVTFLWRAAGSKTPTITRNPFTDVAPSMGMDYYYAILWASQNGIAAGTSATTFSPNATCTRAQIVTFLWRYSNKPAGYYSNPFTDVNKAEHAAYYDAILWAVGKGITKGTTATTFSPYGTCTRGEAVTFLYRAVNGK